MTELDIHYQGLSGELTIDGKEFPQLEKVNCASNFQLTKLTSLISRQPFPTQDLSLLSKFINIEYLSLGDNPFYFSKHGN